VGWKLLVRKKKERKGNDQNGEQEIRNDGGTIKDNGKQIRMTVSK